MSRYQRPVTCFYAKVAGVAYDNRQAAIAKLGALETLHLVPEPDNPHDPNAIKVCRLSGEQIGYLKRKLAVKVVEKTKLGYRCSAFVKRVSGGEIHYASLIVLLASPGATDEEVRDYINRYDVLRGVTIAVSPAKTLVAAPAADPVPDVTGRRRGPFPPPDTSPSIARRFGRLVARLFRS